MEQSFKDILLYNRDDERVQDSKILALLYDYSRKGLFIHPEFQKRGQEIAAHYGLHLNTLFHELDQESAIS